MVRGEGNVMLSRECRENLTKLLTFQTNLKRAKEENVVVWTKIFQPEGMNDKFEAWKLSCDRCLGRVRSLCTQRREVKKELRKRNKMS